MKNTLRNLVMLMIAGILMCGCSASRNVYGYNDENVVVVGDTCYVYYSEPTTTFLNSLHIIDGAYFYWYADRYVPVVFPLWNDWSPYRYFYYEHNRWLWRDRITYNHWRYRKTHPWIDYRKPHHPRITHNPTHRPHNNFRPNNRPNVNHGTYRPNVRPNANTSKGRRPDVQPTRSRPQTHPQSSRPTTVSPRTNSTRTVTGRPSSRPSRVATPSSRPMPSRSSVGNRGSSRGGRR